MSVAATPQPARWPVPVIVLACLCFAPSLGGAFLDWDDTSMVVHNPALAPGRFADALTSWGHPVLSLYAPLTYTAYALLAGFSRFTLNQLDPIVFHVTNLMAHAAGGWLTFVLLKRLETGATAALIGALLWTVHPIQTEPVAWIASLNTNLCTTLAIAALLLQTMALQDSRPTAWRLWLAAAACLTLSLCAKPAAIGLPLAMLGLNRFILRQGWRQCLIVSTAAGLLVLPFLLIGNAAQPMNVAQDLSIWERVIVAGHAIAFYVFKIAIPYPMSADYGLDPASVLDSATAPLAGLVLLPGVVLLFLQRRRRPWLIGAACIFLAGVVPVLGVRPFDFQTFSTVADRYANFALLGVAVAVAFALRDVATRAYVVPAAVAVIVLLASLSFPRAFAWQDTRALHDATVATNPDSLLALMLQGGIAEKNGNLAAQETICRRFLGRRPNEPRMNRTLAYLLLFSGRPAEAVPYFQNAVRARPEASLYADMSLALARSQQWPAALESIDRAIAMNPADATLYVNKGEMFRQTGDVARAAEAYRQALKIDASDPAARAGLSALGTN